MGQKIERTDFSAEDYKEFAAELRHNLAAVKEVMARPGFGVGNRSVGAELELYIINPRACRCLSISNCWMTQLTLVLHWS